MKHRTTLLLCGALLAPLAAAAAGEDRADRYASSAAITLNSTQGLQRLALPLAVLQRSRSAQLADVRVFNAQGEPVPFAWAGAPTPTTAQPQRTPLPRFAWPGSATRKADQALADVRVQVQAGGAVVRVEQLGGKPAPKDPAALPLAWLLDLSPLGESRPQALLLRWRSDAQGVLRAVRVAASRDAQGWSPVGQATLVEVADGSNTRVLQPRIELHDVNQAHRYLRLELDAALPLEQVEAEVAAPAPSIELDRASFNTVAAAEREWTFDTGAVIEARRMQIALAQDNAVAPLQIARRQPYTADARGADTWIAVANHTAYRLQRDGALALSPAFELATSARHWRLVLDARVAPLNPAPEVTLWWPKPQLVFAARGNPPFTLVIGREHSAPAALERSVLMPGYQRDDEFKLAAAALGEPVMRVVAEPGLRDALAQASRDDLRRWLLWAALVLAVAVLGVLAWKLSKDLRRQGP